MDNLIKLEIFVKNEYFNILFNNFRNRYFFYREDRINEILEEYVDREKTVYGEPYEKSSTNIISLSNASHLIENVSVENGKYYGYVKILDTPCGRTFIGKEDILELAPVMSSSGEILTLNIRYRNEI